MLRSLCCALLASLCFLVPVRAAEQAPATVEFVLGPNMKVYLDDDLLKSKPGTHRMETPLLEKGKNFSYTFRVEFEQDGKVLSVTRKITVRAGETAKADFTDLVKAPAKPPVDTPKPQADFKLTDLEREILDRTNAERKQNGEAELKPNAKLFMAARKHSENMAKQDKLAHELDGTTPGSRAKDEGYQGGFIGENCAAGQRSAKEVVDGWMTSEGHRRNILNGNYTEIGIGVAKTANGTPYYTQLFARPAR